MCICVSERDRQIVRVRGRKGRRDQLDMDLNRELTVSELNGNHYLSVASPIRMPYTRILI